MKIKRKIKRIIRFFRYSKHKRTAFKACIYSFYYRFRIMIGKKSAIQSMMGVRGEESSKEIDEKSLYMAAKMAGSVNRITEHMPWEKKCLVRALTLQKLLKEKNIPSTLYLGVRKVDGEMAAHAWLRCGEVYLTGGYCEDYAVVEKFRA